MKSCSKNEWSDIIFQQDNVPVQTAKTTMKWLENKPAHVLAMQVRVQIWTLLWIFDLILISNELGHFSTINELFEAINIERNNTESSSCNKAVCKLLYLQY